MKNILLGLLMIFSIGSFAGELPQSIKFEKDNYFAITQQFNQGLLDNFAEKIFNFKGKELYIYFDTPGGSVIALSQMARIMKSSHIKFTCVANFAASAGFMLFQHCQTRLLLSDGILMSHNWSGTFSDEGPRILTFYNAIQSLIDTLEATAIEKMNVNRAEYLALINNNLWMPSVLATKYAAVDGIIDHVSCSSELLKTKVRFVRRSFFGSRVAYKSACPLIQKTYTKTKGKGEEFIENKATLFSLAQKNYKMGNANWIFKGNKYSFE